MRRKGGVKKKRRERTRLRRKKPIRGRWRGIKAAIND